MFFLLSCGKDEGGSNVPQVDYSHYDLFKGTDGKDSLLVIHFRFEDGDGDLGYREEDTTGVFALGQPYFFNLHTDFYGFDGGGNKTYYLTSFGDTIDYDVRLNSLTPEGRYKAISGRMELRVDFTLLKIEGHSPDKIQLEFFLNDRALNESRRLLTPIIALSL